MDLLQKYLQENIDSNAKVVPERGLNLPLFIEDAYEFFSLKVIGMAFMLIKPREGFNGTKGLHKVMVKVEDVVDCEVVLYLDDITTYTRKKLISERTPFIVDGGQMFIPSLGLDLMRRKQTNLKHSAPFSPMEQLTFLYLLYRPVRVVTAEELAPKLKVSYQHAGRALKSLKERELLIYSVSGKTGRTKIYRRLQDIKKYFRLGEVFLTNPVLKTVHLSLSGSEWPIAGINALAERSMIAEADNDIRAISKKGYKYIKEEDELYNDITNKRTELQIWYYDPVILSKDGNVDLVSLALSFGEDKEPRIEMAINEAMEDMEWLRD